MSTFTRRRLVVSTLSAAAGAAALAALGSGAAFAQATPGASPATTDAGVTDSFPVTIKHVYGETVIEAAATRVVTLGWSTQDAVIALGVDPVGIPANTWGGDAEGFLPWTRTALEGRTLPTILDTGTEIPFEVVAGLKPDLILAPYSGITQDEYGTLSKIAPTVAYADVAWGTSWQDDQTITGKALGRSAAAQKLVTDTEALIASQTDKYPQLKGKTFAYGNMGDGTAFNFYTTTDARSLFLTAIGLEPSAFTKSLDAKAGATAYFVQISLELANTIEADIVVMWFGSEDDYKKAQENTAFQAIPAVKDGRFAAVVGESLVMASSAFSVLSIPYMLDQFIPTLAAAADKVK
ncbi:MAG: iron-siderophore ABC transporter substrate-binding protein [Thermomicrobiales bacterium]